MKWAKKRNFPLCGVGNMYVGVLRFMTRFSTIFNYTFTGYECIDFLYIQFSFMLGLKYLFKSFLFLKTFLFLFQLNSLITFSCLLHFDYDVWVLLFIYFYFFHEIFIFVERSFEKEQNDCNVVDLVSVDSMKLRRKVRDSH